METTTNPITFHCVVCGQDKPENTPPRVTTGYGTRPNGDKVCFECCGTEDRRYMIDHGRITMYLEHSPEHHPGRIVNWPNTLSFPILRSRKGRHNIGRTRWDLWFRGPDGFIWHAIHIGDNNTMARCKRTKRTRF